MQRVVPAMRVNSYPSSRLFYERSGFVERWTHSFGDGLPLFACVARDGMEVNLTEYAGDCSFGGLVHFFVDDVDAYFEEYR